MAFDPSILKPGDILLYRPSGMFGWIIRVKTWHRISHCEAYIGNGQSVASRDGIGVNKYPLRTDQLAYVIRLNPGYDLAKSLAWFETVKGAPYGWRDLINFSGFWHPQTSGQFCSECLTTFVRSGDRPIFNGDPAIEVAPFEFKLVDGASIIWSDGQSD